MFKPMPEIRHVNDAAALLVQASQPLVERFTLIHTAAAEWCVLVEDGGAFELVWSSEWNRLMLIGALGLPAAQRELRALNMALSYNALWRETGCLRMARDAEDGSLLLIGQIDLQGSAPEAVGTALLHFEVLRRGWSEALSGEGAAPPAGGPLSLGPFERV